MPNKNYCNKCGERHFPPTGKKCKRVKEMEESSNEELSMVQQKQASGVVNGTDNDFVTQHSGVPVAKAKKSATSKNGGLCSGVSVHTSTDKDSIVPHSGDPVVKAKKGTGSKKNYIVHDTSSSEEEDTVSLKILQQLECMNSRLE